MYLLKNFKGSSKELPVKGLQDLFVKALNFLVNKSFFIP